MTNSEMAFLLEVVGTEGTSTLLKAIEAAPVLDAVLVPRVILSWLQSAPSFEGPVPGAETAYASFEKNEEGLSGSVEIRGESYDFEGESIFHVAAGIAASLGLTSIDSPEDLRAIDLDRAGRTIDLLVKARRVSSEIQKKADEDDKLSDEEFERKYDAERLKARKAKLDKAIGDSAPPAAPTAAKPQKAGAPKAATIAAPKASIPKATSTSTMSLTRSEAGTPCGDCAGRQFAEDKFVGCLCFEAIAKHVKVTSATDAGLVLELDRRALEQDDVAALADAFKTGVTNVK